LERQTGFVLVHWWYHPDSYDAWIDAHEVEGDTVETRPHIGVWNIVCAIDAELIEATKH
jgi:hypothetical protein